MPSPTAMRSSGPRLPWHTWQKPPFSPRLMCSRDTTPHQYLLMTLTFLLIYCAGFVSVRLDDAGDVVQRRWQTDLHVGPDLFFEEANRVGLDVGHHFVRHLHALAERLDA